jgi:hypothetical protein
MAPDLPLARGFFGFKTAARSRSINWQLVEKGF